MRRCKDCNFYVNCHGYGQCYAQKYAPRVDDDECCDYFKVKTITEDEALEMVKQGLLYDAKGYLSSDGYKALEALEDVDLCICQKGTWKEVNGYDGDSYYECSNCGEPWVLNAGTPKDNNMHYCPNCGAKMTDEI